MANNPSSSNSNHYLTPNECLLINDRLSRLERQVSEKKTCEQRLEKQSNRLDALDPGLVYFAELVSTWKLLGLFPGRQAGAIFLIVTAITAAEGWVMRILLK